MPPPRRSQKITRVYETLLESLPPHAPLPSEREIAVKYGVNRDTIRRALSRLMAQGRIYRLPNKGTYAAPTHRGHTILIVLEDVPTEKGIHTFLPAFLFSMLREFRDADPTLLHAISSKTVFIREVSDLAGKYPNLCGILIFQMAPLLDQHAQALMATRVPILYWGYNLMKRRDYFSAFFINEKHLCERAFDLLRNGGARQFAVWGVDHWFHPVERNRIFMEIVRREGGRLLRLPPPPEVPTGIILPTHAVVESLRKLKKPLGVFTTSDADSLRLVLAAQMAGCPVPNMLQVTGVEGSHLGALSPVPVTHFSIPLTESGIQCARAMLDLIGGGKKRQVDLDIPLTLRQTTLGNETAAVKP